MTLKQYRILKIAVVAILAILVSQSVLARNFVIPVVGIVAANLALLFWRGRVKEIIADERDYEIGGRAARLAIQAYSWLAVAAMLAFYAYQKNNPAFEAVALTLAYSTCLLVLLYSLFFRYHSRVAFLTKKTAYIILGLVILAGFLVAGLRLLSGEDSWLCRDGQWVKHGQPDWPAPTAACRK